MMRLHGGSPKDAERFAARRADHGSLPQVGVMVFPRPGIQETLADKARRLGIPVQKFGSGGG